MLHNVGKEKTPTLQKNLIHPLIAEVKRCKYFQDVKEIYPFDTQSYQETWIRNVDYNKCLKPQKLYGNRLTGLNSQA